MGGFAFFGLTGQGDKDQLRDTCAPLRACSQDDVDAARTKLVIADVALGVGVVALAVATYMFIQRATFTVPAPPRSARARARSGRGAGRG